MKLRNFIFPSLLVILFLVLFLDYVTPLSASISSISENLKPNENYLESEGRELKGFTIRMSEDHLMPAYELMAVGDKLVICKPFASPYYFEVYDLKSLKHLGGFGKQGSGPGQFFGVLKPVPSSLEQGNIGFISRDMGNIYYEINLDSALDSDLYESTMVAELEGFGLNRVSSNNQGELVALSLHSKNRVLIYDQNGENSTGYFDYPFQQEMNNLRSEIFGMAYQGLFVRNFKENKTGIFTMDSPNWDIISFNDDTPKVTSQHIRPIEFRDLSEVSKKSRMFSISKSKRNKKGFLDVTANDERIYALYSGKHFEKFGDDMNFSDKVIVIDWSGNIVDKFDLEYDTQVIAVDNENNWLYSVVELGNESKMVRYELNSIL